MADPTNPTSAIELTDFPDSGDVIVRFKDRDYLTTLNKLNDACLEASRYNFVSHFNNSLAKINQGSCFEDLHGNGYPIRILFPGQPWQSGNVRVRLVVEFLPDEPEAAIQEKSSLLDDLRQDT